MTVSTNLLRGDRAITNLEQDRLGLAEYARRLATALASQAAEDGLVVGLEGSWGSGKSSLLALTLAHLRKHTEKVAVVEFRPWLIGDRDQLLTALFDDLAKTIASVEYAQGDATRTTAYTASEIAEQARRFARHLGPVGKLASLASLALPGADIFGKLLTGLAEAAGQDIASPALAKQKDDLARALKSLSRRIVVTVDDVDRLEPKEVAELLRLVRSVADFPNIVYVLCYDSRTLATAVERGTGVEDGRAYLEKIVQTEFGVPRPESFALRRWFSADLATFAICDEDVNERLRHVIDVAGGRSFDTARTVVRVLDSLRVFWSALEGRVDLADLVWLRILAVGAPNTHRWIEEYIDGTTAIAIGRANIDGRERVQIGRSLDRALEKDGLDWEQVQFDFHAHLPRIGYGKPEAESDGRIFAHTPAYSQVSAVRGRRLASPDHGRLYFALATAAGTIRAEDVDELLAAALRSAAEVASMLVGWKSESNDAGTNKAERMLDHLGHLANGALAHTDSALLALAVTQVADELASGREDEWGSPRPWYLSKAVLRLICTHQSTEQWAGTLRRLLVEGSSIGFLTYLFRDETFGHGIFGGRPDSQDRLTTREQFDTMSEAMLACYRTIGLDGVLRHPSRTSILYAWSQGGGRDNLVADIAIRASSNDWFTSFLEIIFSATRTSHGEFASLSPAAIANFFDDVPSVLERVLCLSAAGHISATSIAQAILRSLSFDGFEDIKLWVERERQQTDETANT